MKSEGVVRNAIIGDDNSFAGGAVGAVTLVVVNTVVDRLALAFPRFRVLVEGSATVVVRDGRADAGALRKLGCGEPISTTPFGCRTGNIGEVGTGRLEPGGQLILTLKPEEQDATHADIAALQRQLDRIEASLTGRTGS